MPGLLLLSLLLSLLLVMLVSVASVVAVQTCHISVFLYSQFQEVFPTRHNNGLITAVVVVVAVVLVILVAAVVAVPDWTKHASLADDCDHPNWP